MTIRRNVLTTGLLAALAAGGATAAPVLTPDAARLSLDEIGLYDAGYAYDGKPEVKMPTGWQGGFTDDTGISLQPAAAQNGRPAFLMHSPWRGGSGKVFQEFTFALPAGASRIVLRGATAMRAENTEKSDGVTFRIYVDGNKVLDEHRADTEWKPFEIDLSEKRGKNVTVRFENDPGPARNANFDFSLWGGRELAIDGVGMKIGARPAPPALDLTKLAPVRGASVAPVSGFAYKTTALAEGQTRILRYTGKDGTLEYRWQLPASASDPVFGKIVLRSKMIGGASYDIPVAGDAKIEWAQPAEFVRASWERIRGDWTGTPHQYCRLVYRVGGQEMSVLLDARIEGKSLAIKATSNETSVARISAGGFGPVVRRRQMTTPFYTYNVFYLPHENLFVGTFPDWITSKASSHDGVTATYNTLTDGRRNPLDTTFVYTAAWHLAETLPNIPNPPSPYRKLVGGKVVYDIWGGSYLTIARNLETLADYGLTDAIALIHSWQHQGYDNGLPGHLPANPKLGGDKDMKTLVDTAKRHNILIGLHENYVDYYTNYEEYDEKHISLDSKGEKVKAWFNKGTQMQSFGIQPHAVLPLAKTQSPRIKERFGTNTSFLDVHSAVAPWFHVDHRATEAGAGTFRPVWDAHAKLWQFHRDTYGGPVFGEGNRHWFWSGLLDGVEAQYGTGWPDNTGETAPLAVDFNLLKVHPLQINHGMGYMERWWSDRDRVAPPTMALMDQYRMQEIAYGHTGFLGGRLYTILPLSWLEHNLMTPVTARTASGKVAGIAYEFGGKWVDGTAAAKTGTWNRVRVRYDNGLVLTVNDAEAPLSVGTYRLPRFGWVAEGAGVTAWSAQRGNARADYAETATSVFANARAATDWNLRFVGGLKQIRPTVAEFAQTGPRQIRIGYKWAVNDTLRDDHQIFVHFTSDRPQPAGRADGIHFQQDHNPPSPTSAWKPGTTLTDGPFTLNIPAEVADGDYDWMIGMYKGERVQLQGPGDGGKVRLGTIQIRDNGAKIAFVPETRTGEEGSEAYLNGVNPAGTVIDFGAVRTDGSVRIVRDGADWVMQTYPRNRAFTLELSAARFGKPTAIRCDGGASATIAPVAAGTRWRVSLNGARAYRWKAGK